MDNEMDTCYLAFRAYIGQYWGDIGNMEKKIETIMGEYRV